LQSDKGPVPSNQIHLDKIGITIGDCNGIGPEIIIRTLKDRRISEINTIIIYGQSRIITHYMKILSIQDFRFQVINNVGEARAKRINLINCVDKDGFVEPGVESDYSGQLSLKALEKAGTDLKEGKISAVVTAPVSKSNLKKQGFSFPGQTEYFASLDPGSKPLMILVSDLLRIGLVTGHIPVITLGQECTREKVQEKLDVMIKTLKKDFGIHKPKIAVLGLNPHAGENGLVGTEELDWMGKLILGYKESGHLVFGPMPSDGLFGSGNYKKFDALLAMYHDQGLIPFKTLAFDEGVNFTAGLNFVRTSPDHGTAFDIAGKGNASISSFRSSIRLAIDLLAKRRDYYQ
jgi:4-hydroxythreonine-4-phosphate dehydrogenase